MKQGNLRLERHWRRQLAAIAPPPLERAPGGENLIVHLDQGAEDYLLSGGGPFGTSRRGQYVEGVPEEDPGESAGDSTQGTEGGQGDQIEMAANKIADPFEEAVRGQRQLDDRVGHVGAGTPNYLQAFSLEEARRRRIATTFATIINKVAEDLVGWPVEGDDEWSVPAVMERRITRRYLAACRQSREKQAVVVILDTSGSCRRQAYFFSRIATAAADHGDVELYAAPNAGLHAKRTRGGWEKVENRDWPFHYRTIIFFGDFDGGDRVVQASWHNELYWFCCEGNRYPGMSQHPWCSLSLADFRGHFFACEQDDDFIRLARKVR